MTWTRPKRSFQSVVNELIDGLESGEIVTGQDILPCPLCGGRSLLQDQYIWGPLTGPERIQIVRCQDCGLTLPAAAGDDSESLIKRWNRRVLCQPPK